MIYHYGIPRRSGRYPWGSGKDPYQSAKIKKANTSKIGQKYTIVDDNGSIMSELKCFDYNIKGFDWILVADVMTKPEYRRHGLSSKLINEVYHDIVQKDSKKGIYLFVKNSNKPAIKLYEKLKFQTIKEYKLKNGTYLIMGKGNADPKQFGNFSFS